MKTITVKRKVTLQARESKSVSRVLTYSGYPAMQWEDNARRGIICAEFAFSILGMKPRNKYRVTVSTRKTPRSTAVLLCLHHIFSESLIQWRLNEGDKCGWRSILPPGSELLKATLTIKEKPQAFYVTAKRIAR